jgi:hypothetical protein
MRLTTLFGIATLGLASLLPGCDSKWETTSETYHERQFVFCGKNQDGTRTVIISDTTYPTDAGSTPQITGTIDTPGLQYWETIKRDVPQGHHFELYSLADINAAYDACWETERQVVEAVITLH